MKGMRKRPSASDSGFTLLEIMVALAVISISLVVLLAAQNANIERSVHASRLTRAALVGQKIISGLELSELEEGKWEGKEEVGELLFSWEKRVEPSVVVGVLKVIVRVTWGDDEGGDAFLIETFRVV